jgi:hypothetical protein
MLQQSTPKVKKFDRSIHIPSDADKFSRITTQYTMRVAQKVLQQIPYFDENQHDLPAIFFCF